MSIKRIPAKVWSEWDIDDNKAVKAYNDKLELIGWLYFAGSLVLLEL